MVRKRKNTERRGLALVEFALVLPLLLMLVLGAIRYGHFFLKAQQISNAARHGARLAILPDADESAAAVRLNIDGMMNAARMPDYEVTLSGVPAAVGGEVTVQVRVLAANIDVVRVPLFTDLEPAGWYVGTTVTMAKEGF